MNIDVDLGWLTTVMLVLPAPKVVLALPVVPLPALAVDSAEVVPLLGTTVDVAEVVSLLVPA